MIIQKLRQVLDILFPEQIIFARQFSIRKQVGIFWVLLVIFYSIGYFIPANGFIAFDWIHFFSTGSLPPYYPPWGELIIHFLNWPLLFGSTLAGVGLSIIKRSVHIVSAISALLALPVLWTIFLGQLEGLVVVGLLGLPWLAPLAMMKPQVSIFAFCAKRHYFFAGILWLFLAFMIWGFWSSQMIAVNTYHEEGRFVNNIAIGISGIVIALPLFWFSRGDMDMLMVSGAFMTPYLLPYNMMPFILAIARLKPALAVIACLLSWLPLSANWIGSWGWWLGWLVVVWLWGCLAWQRYHRGTYQIMER